MIGRRAIVGLSLLCALAFCAFAASSASANTNTTAFTCVEKVKGEFKDAHCVEQVTPGTGSFSHEVIALNTQTEIGLTNQKTKSETKESTPTFLGGPLAGIEVAINCNTVNGSGFVENEQPSAGVHETTGTMTIEQTGCTVTKPSNCTVQEPLTYNVEFAPIEKEKQMGFELTGQGEWGKIGAFVFQGSKCTLKEKPFEINGSFGLTVGGAAEGKGATLTFDTEIGSLTWGGKPYILTGTITLSMRNKGVTENPITFTTAT